MVIGILTVQVRIPQAGSLKEKRQVLKSMKDRMRNGFNVSITEVDGLNRKQEAVLAIVQVSTDNRHTNSILSRVINFLESFKQIDILDYKLQIL
jgi:uncharacterized protein YlxP (DUF503 family)